MSFCSYCKKYEVRLDPVQNVEICEDCGYVQDESVCKSEIEFSKDTLGVQGTNLNFLESATGGLVNMSNLDRFKGINSNIQAEQRVISAQKRTQQRIEQLCEALKIPQRFVSEIYGYVNSVSTDRFTKEKWIDQVIGSCIYTVARQQSLPITFLDLSESMGISLYKLGKRHREVSDKLKIKVTSPDPFELLDIYAIKLEKKLGSKEEISDTLRNAARIIRIAKVDWLNQGRRPSPIAGAALKFGAELGKRNLDFQVISEVTGSGPLSIRERYKEIQQVFYKVLQTLPWGKSVKIKDLNHHIPFLMGYIETVNKLVHEVINPLEIEEIQLNQIIKIEPPSFVKSQKGRERRKEKIAKAKERIKKVFENSSNSNIDGLDGEDLEIEKLLLSGAKEEDLLEGNFHIQKKITTFDVNSEDLTEHDIPENQISDFIKSEEEITFYEQFPENSSEEEQRPLKKKKQ